MNYKSDEQIRKTSHCLECGDEISYGRTDKKFCCEECRVKHNNSLGQYSRMYRRRVLRSLQKNYEILQNLIRDGVESIDIIELNLLGFNPACITSYQRVHGRVRFSCYDIKYIISENRLFGLTRMTKVKNL